MTTQAEKLYPSGPDEAYDLNTVPESFDKVAELLAEYGDICRIPPVNRTHDTYLINHPDYIRHVLLNNADKYYKGPGFERVKMLLGNGNRRPARERKSILPGSHRNWPCRSFYARS